ncbi:L-asparaginase [Streptomyces sp. SAJ15]|nr:L-asparaginase [Streptomyces sp. SAJ15]
MGQVVVISTGGTIASRWQGSGFAADARGGDVLATAAVPEGVLVRVVDLMSVNSARLTTRDQLALLRTVHEVLADPDVDGIVVTHGTDTLEESAFLLDLHHHDPRPVVFTGAQLPLEAPNGDGPRNLHDALLAASTASMRDMGVLVVFDGQVHAARGTVKVRTLAADAFADPSGSPVADVKGGRLLVHRRPERPTPLPLPADGEPLPRVDIVTHHCDADPVLFDAAVAAGARGIVLVATGAGNATPEMAAAVAAAVSKGVLVALTTRVPSGPVAEIYTQGGAVDLAAAGAVLTGTLRAGQSRIAVLAAVLATPDADDTDGRTRALRHTVGASTAADGTPAVADSAPAFADGSPTVGVDGPAVTDGAPAAG